MKFLMGKDYPELCEKCRAAIDSVVELVMEGEDTDDPEAPCMFVYDNRMFCGGHECVNHTPPYFVEKLKEPYVSRITGKSAYWGVFEFEHSVLAHALATEEEAVDLCKRFNEIGK